MNDLNYLYDGASDYYSKYFAEPCFSEKKLGFAILKNATLLPHRILENGMWGGGVVDQDGNYIQNSAVHNCSGAGYLFDTPSQKIDKAIYLGMFNGVWGHCITDNIRRAWFLQSDEYAEYRDYKLVYVPIEGFHMHENFRKLLDYLGIREDRLVSVTEVTECEELILPDESFFTEDGDIRRYTKEYKDTIDIIKQNAAGGHISEEYEKIYLTFSGSDKMYGEENLEDYFRSKGYQIVDFGNVSLENQLRMLANCRSLAGTIGSSTHNAAFLSEGSELILIPRAYYLTGYQLAINEMRGLDVKYVDASLSDGTRRDMPYLGPFFTFVSDELRGLFGDALDESRNQSRKMLKAYYKYRVKSSFIHKGYTLTPPDYYKQRVSLQTEKWYEKGHLNKHISPLYKGEAFLALILDRFTKMHEQ